MSRVTKLKKLYRRLYNAKKDRWCRNSTKSRRIRRAQGGKLYDWEPGHRTPTRGTWNVVDCRCGHKRHGKYGCEQGCAWGTCGDHAPLMLNPIYDESHLMREFEAIRASRTAALLTAFALPGGALRGMDEFARIRSMHDLADGTAIVVIGDSHITDLVADVLDKQP